MLVVTIENVPGKKITDVVGLVKGSAIRAKYIKKDVVYSFKQIGGEITAYDEILSEVGKIAIEIMVKDAESKGANAIIGFRLTSVGFIQETIEILAYGTGVVVESND